MIFNTWQNTTFTERLVLWPPDILSKHPYCSNIACIFCSMFSLSAVVVSSLFNRQQPLISHLQKLRRLSR